MAVIPDGWSEIAMSNGSMYDSAYGKYPNFFGPEPDKLLTEHYHLLDKSKPILDLGAGQGRHTFYLGARGYTVHAIEPSLVACDALTAKAEAEDLKIHVFNSSLENYGAASDSYSGILLFGLMQELTWDMIHLLLERIDTWCCRGGHIFITAFRSDDPSLARSSEWTSIGKNSYVINGRLVRTFLEPNEILGLFENYESVYHWEGLGPEHRHGNGPLERHASIRAVFRK
jgi:SAM-dependent methyltransferase